MFVFYHFFVFRSEFSHGAGHASRQGKLATCFSIASGKNLSRFGDASQRTSYFQPSTLFVQLTECGLFYETKSLQPHFSYLLLKKYSQERKLSCGLVAAQDADIFLFDRRIRPASGPVKHAGTKNHLRSLEELIPFEEG